LILSTVWNMYY